MNQKQQKQEEEAKVKSMCNRRRINKLKDELLEAHHILFECKAKLEVLSDHNQTQGTITKINNWMKGVQSW